MLEEQLSQHIGAVAVSLGAFWLIKSLVQIFFEWRKYDKNNGGPDMVNETMGASPKERALKKVRLGAERRLKAQYEDIRNAGGTPPKYLRELFDTKIDPDEE